jgi:hypothetical protein
LGCDGGMNTKLIFLQVNDRLSASALNSGRVAGLGDESDALLIVEDDAADGRPAPITHLV